MVKRHCRADPDLPAYPAIDIIQLVFAFVANRKRQMCVCVCVKESAVYLFRDWGSMPCNCCCRHKMCLWVVWGYGKRVCFLFVW
jgi:hypothetical protein